MLKFLNSLLKVCAGIAIGVWLSFFVLVTSDIRYYKHNIEKAVEQCEKDLPRSKHCEPVFSARIVEEE